MRSALALVLALAACVPLFPETFEDAHGISVDVGSTDVTRPAFEREVDRVLEEWRGALAWEGVDCDPAAHLPTTYVEFLDEYPLHVGSLFGGRDVLGYVSWPFGWTHIRVAWRPHLHLAHSSLGHELGHAFLRTCGQPHDEPGLIWWRDHHGVPY